MRTSHRENPLHRIEYWTGEFFRPAQLWEVGAYILVPHCTGDGICASLEIQEKMLEASQTTKDQKGSLYGDLHGNEEELSSPIDADREEGDQVGVQPADPTSPARDITDEEHEGGGQVRVSMGSRIHMMYTMGRDSTEPDEAHDEDNDNPVVDGEAPSAPADPEVDVIIPEAPDLPRMDAMANDYVRIVHTNGIHYIPLVICHCRGITSRDTDLMYARLVPTSFIHYRTVFTTAVLDNYRLSNLECKTSAFQYWQMLSRMTSPVTSPSDVDNFCRELRRLSRCWRWLKKLKWAGVGRDDENRWNTGQGALAIFCPTCPQPGINLADDWRTDENK